MKNLELVFGIMVAICSVICVVACIHVITSDVVYIPETRIASASILAIVGLMFGTGAYQIFEGYIKSKQDETSRI